MQISLFAFLCLTRNLLFFQKPQLEIIFCLRTFFITYFQKYLPLFPRVWRSHPCFTFYFINVSFVEMFSVYFRSYKFLRFMKKCLTWLAAPPLFTVCVKIIFHNWFGYQKANQNRQKNEQKGSLKLDYRFNVTSFGVRC